jgi:acyl-CoA thioesterase-2
MASSSPRTLDALLALAPDGPGRWCSRHGDPNMNGRTYGGQLLGLALRAALHDVPPDRAASMMQFLFLQGAMPDEAINLQVTPLQDGRRFSARHVRASQGSGRTVLDAQVTCARALDAPFHAVPSAAPTDERPESLARTKDLDAELLGPLSCLGGYSGGANAFIDMRLPEPDRQLALASMGGRLRFWLRISKPLSPDPKLHVAAFGYLSDWWLNFAALGLHLRALGGRRLYIASLNHAMWLHRPFRADEWLHVDSHSPNTALGRGFSRAIVHDAQGLAVASLTQECLVTYAD